MCLYTLRCETYAGAARMPNQLDEAFNWLVIILSIIASALTNLKQISWISWGEIPSNIDYLLLRQFIFPIVFLVFFWLWSFLAKKGELQIMLKFFSWTFASLILIVDLVMFGPLPVIRSYFPVYPFVEGGPPITVVGILLVCYSLVVIFPLFLSFFVIRPRMREIYKDSKFLNNTMKQVLLFLAAVLLFLIAVGLLENILLGEVSPTLPQSCLGALTSLVDPL